MPDGTAGVDGRQRLEAAVARLEAAVALAATAGSPAAATELQALRERNDRLQAAMREALSRIDRLLAGA